MKKIWKSVVKEGIFQKQFVINDENMYHMLRKEFDFFINVHMLDTIIEFFTIKHLLEIEKPKTFAMYGEASSLGRMFAHWCRIQKVKSVAVQHGLLQDYYHYGRSKFSVSEDKNISAECCPLFDQTLVYGSHYKKWLIEEANYQPDWITVTGDSRSDILANIDNLFDYNSICAEYGFNKNSRHLLFTPTNLREEDDYLKSIFRAVKRLKNVHLIIKLHPRTTDFSYYSRIALSVGLKNFAISKNYDLYKLYIISDLLISSGSTTILEAAVLKKPVIITNSSVHIEYGDTLSRYLAKNVRTEAEIYEAFEFKPLSKYYTKFIGEFYYKLDGKCSKRIADYIVNTIR